MVYVEVDDNKELEEISNVMVGNCKDRWIFFLQKEVYWFLKQDEFIRLWVGSFNFCEKRKKNL